MEAPSVCNELRDSKRKVVYRILAYRRTTRDEMLFAVAQYLRQSNGKQPKSGSVITIITTLGFDGR